MSKYGYISHSELYHHGIKGMKWGIRRYQNADGSLTPEGERKYGNVKNFNKARMERKYKIRRAAAIGAGIAGVAGFATLGGVHIKKRIDQKKSIDKQRALAAGQYIKDNNMVFKYTKFGQDLKPKISKNNTNIKKELHYLYDNRDVLLKDGTSKEAIKRNRNKLKDLSDLKLDSSSLSQMRKKIDELDKNSTYSDEEWKRRKKSKQYLNNIVGNNFKGFDDL